MSRVTGKRYTTPSTKPTLKGQSRSNRKAQSSSDQSFSQPRPPIKGKFTKPHSRRYRGLNGKKETQNLEAKNNDGLHTAAKEFVLGLTRLGLTYSQILSKAEVNFTFLSELFEELDLPLNSFSETGEVSGSTEIQSQLNSTDPTTQYGPKSLTNNNNTTIKQNENTEIKPQLPSHFSSLVPTDPLTEKLQNHDLHTSQAYLQPDKTIQTVNVPKNNVEVSDIGTEQLPKYIFESTSRILMKTRLELLKLKNSLRHRTPIFSKDIERSLKRKRSFLMSDVENFYTAIGLKDEFAPGSNDDFIEISDSLMEESDQEEYLREAPVTQGKDSSAYPNDTANNDSSVVPDTVIHIERSRPDHFTPYQSLNFTE